MNIDRLAQSLVQLAEAVGGARISGSAFFAGAKTLIADGGLSRAWKDIEEHHWSDLVDVGIERGARIIGVLDPPLAPIAPLLATLIVYARHHPAGTLSHAMARADGVGGVPATSNTPV